jgi:hypothetical protein
MTGKSKYSKHSDEKEIDYTGVRSVIDCLEILRNVGSAMEQLQRAVNECENPTKKMQSLADSASIIAQSLIPKLAKLGKFREAYNTEFQSICEHKWSDYDDYETCIGGDDTGGRIIRARMCELCYKIEPAGS